LSYVVTSASTREPLKLLQNVNGILRPGRMCALMVRVDCFSFDRRWGLILFCHLLFLSFFPILQGSSGAGKTTLMVRTILLLVVAATGDICRQAFV
jgi:hypothetical protein